MVLDGFDVRAEKESAVNIVDWDRTYFLTKELCENKFTILRWISR